MTSAHHITLALRRGNFAFAVDVGLPDTGCVGVFGPSGAGKTTLLRCIAGLEPEATGRLTIAGSVWSDSAAGLHLPPWKRPVGYVFQEPRLFSHLSVAGNLNFARRTTGPKATDALFESVVELLDLGALLDRRTRKLSGGERKRIAIARALVRDPQLLLLDEPLAGLDAARQAEVLSYLDRLQRELTLPIIVVSHSLDELIHLCDALIVMDDGTVAASGPIAEVLVQRGIDALAGRHSSSALTGRIAEYADDDDLTCVAFDDVSLWVPGRHGDDGDAVRVRVRADDVSLCLRRPDASTILNIVPATVREVREAAGASADVLVQVGEQPLLARVTRRSARTLDLRVGLELYAQIKSVAVR
ncbi:MAG: molybdenum ABC transporter ATP-binding protein [Pseudomonadota bacterium]